MHRKRKALAVIAMIYVAVLSIGYLSLPFFRSYSLTVSYLLISLIMTSVVFIFSLLLRNASVYDPYWSVIPPFLLLSRVVLLSESPRLGTLFILLALFFWGGRLTYNWTRNWRGFDHQDWRYTMLMQKNDRTALFIDYFGIHLFPTLIVYLQLIAAMKVIETNPGLNPGLFFSGTLIIGATILQATADRQMYRHRHEEAGRAVFERGLWRHSRHPNYLAEVLVWWGVYLAYPAVFYRLDFHVLAPIAMTGLFLFISIPMLEKRMVSKHADYADYQERVPMLIPTLKARHKRSVVSDKRIGG
ncbi:MAG: DUF1295 domain-containing protein [Acholeplasmataceae bacterium]